MSDLPRCDECGPDPAMCPDCMFEWVGDMMTINELRALTLRDPAHARLRDERIAQYAARVRGLALSI